MPTATGQRKPTAMLLGPHPGNGIISISKYFAFYRNELPSQLPEVHIEHRSPGKPEKLDAALTRPFGRLDSWWQNYIVWPRTLASLRADLFHVMDQGLAWYGGYLKGGRRLITVHDLITYLTWTGKLDFEKISSRRALLLQKCIGEIVKADHIISVSEHTADCLVNELHIPRRNITVIPNYVSQAYSPLTPSERKEARNRRYGLAEYVVIHVGKAFAYKNRMGALRSFALLHKSLAGAEMYLVSDPATPEEMAFVKQTDCASAFHFLSGIAQSDLRELYGSADAMIFPSRYEGFGLPPLEAMACGCPVVATSRPALGEVVRDAALTVDDPEDHRALAAHLEAILTNPALARDLRQRGFERVRGFTPEVMLGRMAAVYRALLD
jgi:glycosyltransferase involved in cell wall biosynthesis